MCEWTRFLSSLWDLLTKDLDAGDWPTFVGSIFAGLAALAAIWTLAKQRKDSKDRSQFELRRQASQIAAWVTREETPKGGSAFASGAIRTIVCVSNPSGVPVFNLDLRVYSDDVVVMRKSVPLLPPTDTPMCIDISREVFEKKRIELEANFIDGNGVAWRRGREFSLTKSSNDFKLLQPGTWRR